MEKVKVKKLKCVSINEIEKKNELFFTCYLEEKLVLIYADLCQYGDVFKCKKIALDEHRCK